MKALAALAIALAPALAAAQPAPPARSGEAIEHSNVDVAPAGHAFKQLSIDNPLGDVQILGYDGTAIKIETIKHAPDDITLDRLHVSLVPDPDGTVRLQTSAARSIDGRVVPRSAMRVDVIVHAPHDLRVDAAVVAGKLHIENMDAGGELDAASGPITVKNVAGELWTHTVTGRTTLSEVFGSVDAATIEADLDLDSINGDRLIASVNRGDIAGRRVRSRDVELTTTHGTIWLDAEASLRGRLVVSSMYGNIDVRLRHHGGVIARARGTKVDLGMAGQPRPDGWFQSSFGKISDTAAMVELRSSFGSVRFAIIE